MVSREAFFFARVSSSSCIKKSARASWRLSMAVSHGVRFIELEKAASAPCRSKRCTMISSPLLAATARQNPHGVARARSRQAVIGRDVSAPDATCCFCPKTSVSGAALASERTATVMGL